MGLKKRVWFLSLGWLSVVLLVVFVAAAAYGQSFNKGNPGARERAAGGEFVDINTKKVRFPHGRHQDIVERIGESCDFCHHDKKAGKNPLACRKCHAKRDFPSKGKYGRVGQKLNVKDTFHFFCRDCHRKMLKGNFKRKSGAPASIPTRCHHCHERKEKDRLAAFSKLRPR